MRLGALLLREAKKLATLPLGSSWPAGAEQRAQPLHTQQTKPPQQRHLFKLINYRRLKIKYY